MKFELPTELSSIIKVIGVGGGGSNAVNHMHAQGINSVDFIICNTDKQALDMSRIPVKLQIGTALTEGLGAGSVPERGGQAAQENIEEIRQLLNTRTKMLFITAGMGGGTGTGAAPVIARIARDMGILTVGIVTMPFAWEGRKRKQQATTGVEELRNAVDTLLVINNDRLRDLYGNLSMDAAFAHADDVLTTAARGIADIINKTGKVNVDFEDVRTVMSNSGVAIMGMAEAEGEDRAIRAAQDSLNSPLLNDSDIKGARFVLLNVEHGSNQLQMDEMTEITDHIEDAAGQGADVIWGICHDESLGDRLRVTVIATGFNQNPLSNEQEKTERKVTPLGDIAPTIITAPITSPLTGAPKPAPVPVEDKAADFVLKTKTVEPVVEVKEVEQVKEALTEPKREQARIVFEAEQPVAEKPAVDASAPLSAGKPVEEKSVVAATPTTTPAPDKKVHELYATPEVSAPDTDTATLTRPAVADSAPSPVEAKAGQHEHQNRVEDRLSRMREMTQKLRQPNGLSDLEREPAYKRKNPTFTDTPHSSESSVSRYTLTEDTDENGDRSVQLRKNNAHLHDQPD